MGNTSSSGALPLRNARADPIVDMYVSRPLYDKFTHTNAVFSAQNIISKREIAQVPMYAYAGAAIANSPLPPTDTYDGGYGEAKDVLLRIANGGVGNEHVDVVDP